MSFNSTPFINIVHPTLTTLIACLSPFSAPSASIFNSRTCHYIVFGVKQLAICLIYIFKDEDFDDDNNAPHVRVTRATPVLPDGVTDDTPDFDREMVMLDIPDKLFGSSFSMLTDITQILGKWVQVRWSSLTAEPKLSFDNFILVFLLEFGATLRSVCATFQAAAGHSTDCEGIESTAVDNDHHRRNE